MEKYPNVGNYSVAMDVEKRAMKNQHLSVMAKGAIVVCVAVWQMPLRCV